MRKIVLNRQKLGLEDLLFGVGIVTQIRAGQNVDVTRINAGNLPFDETQSLLEWAQSINLDALSSITTELKAIYGNLTTIGNVEDNLPALNNINSQVIPNLTELLLVNDNAIQVAADKVTVAADKGIVSGYKDDVSVMKVAVESIYDTFDDRFLGVKTNDPILDNDGNALQDGAMYFNGSSNALKVYSLDNTTWYTIPQIYLSGLLDVTLTSITTGDALLWNGTKWVNIALASLFISKVASIDNAIVRFNGTTGEVQNSGVVIDDSNNVGIGVTPSAWDGMKQSITLKGAGSLIHGGISSPGGDVNDTTIFTNCYYNSGWKYVYPFAHPATKYECGSGTHTWYTAPLGTAGNPITWTNAMTLGSNGNLLVGTTTDTGVDKLQVNGSINVTNYVNTYGGIKHFNYYHTLMGGAHFVIDFTLREDDHFDIEVVRSGSVESQFNKYVFTQMGGIGQYVAVNNQSSCSVSLISSTTNAYRYSLTIPTSGAYTGFALFIKYRNSAINTFS